LIGTYMAGGENSFGGLFVYENLC